MSKLLPLIFLFYCFHFTTTQGQNLSPDQLNFLQENSKIIYENEIKPGGNWQPVLDAVKDKNIVLLGEFTHGAGEIFLSRNELIKELHEKLGFNTILFESGIGELAYVDLKRADLSPTRMTYGFFGGWRTQEWKDLMAYLKKKNISVGGFDVQRTGGAFKVLLKEVAQKENLDSTIYIDLEKRFGRVGQRLRKRKMQYDSVKIETHQLIHDYKTIYQLFKQSSESSEMKEYSLQTLLNRIAYLKYRLQFLKDKDWNQRWLFRDSMMAENIIWLSENRFKNEKLIIGAHNFHISKQNEKEAVMGEFLKESFGSQMYALGVFGGKGFYNNNAGKPKEMLPADSTHLDIKHIINQSNGFTTFLNIPKNQHSNNNWLFDPIIVNDSFIDLSSSSSLILAKCFDGILLIDEVSPPKKMQDH